jgi:SPP1 gp7 family putative phage head morphogenesis protein
MEEVITYNKILNYDPTRTTSLRNAFARDMNRRFNELVAVVKETVNVRDCFGLKEGVITFQMTPSGARAFAFPRSAEKVEAFMKWLQEQVDKGILSVTQYQQIGLAVESAWTNMYISDSYKRGIMRARYELKKAGLTVPSVDETGGIDLSMSTPFHLDRLGLLFTRVFSDLRGVTAAMDMQISRILAQGIADGDGAALLARKLVAVINGDGVDRLGLTDTLGRFIPAQRRAMLIARTEIIRAFHQATIQEYRNWAIEGVYVQAEWMTAGDDRVCEQCASMQGKIFTLDEIEPMIPAHPQCRCIALPYIEDIVKYYK